MTSTTSPKLNIYPLENYAITSKEPLSDEDVSVQARIERLKAEYSSTGHTVKNVEAVMLVHEHNFPHVLMLQTANTYFRLPGTSAFSQANLSDNSTLAQPGLESDYLLPNPGADTIAAAGANTSIIQSNAQTLANFRKCLNCQLAPLKSDSSLETEFEDLDWQFGEVVSCWYRPNFETEMYPYLPAHVSNPKELVIYQTVNLPERRKLCIPKNSKLVAVPLFELYENSNRYGPQLAALAHNLSRFDFVLHK
ncbi:Pre-mRNA cleavage factor Im 25 kDa subunit 2 [Smittium culicis]|uniref:Cleavage and polyadenylation specificity factor subunit 5 n=1 Tax=Smittium culicis TaxID=133412 RepID=A0A1R1XKE6_9FUNG|nr:Pre-mRNA cleavage factor Im 25 kDa subunit 2 [Smittium culicis]